MYHLETSHLSHENATFIIMVEPDTEKYCVVAIYRLLWGRMNVLEQWGIHCVDFAW